MKSNESLVAVNVLVVAVGLLLGRLTGFFREILLAYYFGATGLADTTIVILTLPDFVVGLLLSGALSKVLIPEFAAMSEQAKRDILFQQASIVVVFVFGILSFLLSLNSNFLVTLLAPGLSGEHVLAANNGIGVVVWALPLSALAGVTTAYLQSKHRFVITSLGTVFVNTAVIFGILYIGSTGGAVSLIAAFVILGGFVRWASQVTAVGKQTFLPDLLQHSVVDRGVPRRYAEALLASSILLVLPVIARAVASLNEPGSIALFNYAVRLVELPLGVSITVFSVAVFPYLSDCFQNNKREEGIKMTGLAAQMVIYISLSIAFPLMWFSHSYVEITYGWGKISDENLAVIATLTTIGLAALPAQGLSSITIAAFSSLKDMRTPFYINLGALLAFVPLAILGNKIAGLVGIMGT